MNTTDTLRTLFRRADAIEQQRRRLQARINEESRRYADETGCRVIPRPEAIRRAVGA